MIHYWNSVKAKWLSSTPGSQFHYSSLPLPLLLLYQSNFIIKHNIRHSPPVPIHVMIDPFSAPEIIKITRYIATLRFKFCCRILKSTGMSHHVDRHIVTDITNDCSCLIFLDYLMLQMKTPHSIETKITTYQMTLNNNPEDFKLH